MIMQYAKSIVLIAAILSAFSTQPSFVAAQIFELRIYTAKEGKLDALNARFRDHTVGLFERHGMESMGYWVPTDGALSENTLIYVLKHESREAAKQSWKAFIEDPQWKKAYEDSQKDGPLLAKSPVAIYMEATDYSPEYENAESSDEAVFELRTYRCNEGKLAGLDSRFRDHTIDLFKKHGIESVAYWHALDKPDSNDTLIYIIKHKSHDAAKKSWQSFVADPQWKKVAEQSQKDGQFLRERPESIYMKATDYSAMK